MKITIKWRDASGKVRRTKHEVRTAKWNDPGFDRRNYCRGVCQVLGGKLIEFKEAS